MLKLKKRILVIALGLISSLACFSTAGALPHKTYASPTRTPIMSKGDLTFTESIFGESTDTAYNGVVSGNVNGALKLQSINSKGKFTTSGYDGMTFYNTKIDANAHDFYLEATITVEQIGNASGVVSGQEGFALMARDSLGTQTSGSSVTKDGQYSNSVSAICTKITYKSPTGANVDIKDGIGMRVVEGVTDPNAPPVSISQGGKFQTTYAVFDRDEVAYNGAVYKFSLEKINNSYVATYYKNELMTYTETCYPTRDTDKDKLLSIDNRYIYVGFGVARDCIATFSDITFDLYPRSTEKIEIPIKQVASAYAITSQSETSDSNYNFVYTSNQRGKLAILANEQTLYQDIDITENQEYSRVIQLTSETTNLEAVFTPQAGWIPEEGSVMTNYGVHTTRKTVTLLKYGNEGETIVVAPNGSDNGAGTSANPLSLKKAINFAQRGQIILVKEGRYNISGGLLIQRGNDGAENALKRIVADPSATTRPIFDMQKSGGFVVMGNYWHIKGIDITNTGDKEKGITVWGNNNTLELINAYLNGNTGIQISGSSNDGREKWPKNNLVLNCTSYWNYDANFEDADGFAAKLTCGEGNVFRGCIAYENADDGYDLYAKAETGSIGLVLIENSIAFRNGFVPSVPGMNGGGNGFKLGGGNMPGAHIIRNSIAFGNLSKGIDSNSGPDVQVYNVTSFDNQRYNYALYSSVSTNFKIDGAISMRTDATIGLPQADKENWQVYTQVIEDDIKSLRNYFWEAGKSVNRGGRELTLDIFVSIVETEITRDEDGSINMHGFLELNDNAPSNSGARLVSTGGEQIVFGAEVGGGNSGGETGGDDDDRNDRCFGITYNNQGGNTMLLMLCCIMLLALIVRLVAYMMRRQSAS